MPQGSILGPLLFCLYTSVLPPAVENADDTEILHYVYKDAVTDLNQKVMSDLDWMEPIRLAHIFGLISLNQKSQSQTIKAVTKTKSFNF